MWVLVILLPMSKVEDHVTAEADCVPKTPTFLS